MHLSIIMVIYLFIYCNTQILKCKLPPWAYLVMLKNSKIIVVNSKNLDGRNKFKLNRLAVCYSGTSNLCLEHHMTRLLEQVLCIAAFVDNVSTARLMVSIQNE